MLLFPQEPENKREDLCFNGRIKLELPEISMRSRLTFFFKEALGYGGGHSTISTMPRGDTKERLEGK